ncbi:MAG: M42 family metallopeptidase [Candidatus Omnitrophica bacterium]|jgi:endoglucanase|nr:M42 family metallopeptidase [Candidatus Omnitrophota bacterium]
MDPLLKKVINAAGVSGYESEITKIMYDEFKKITKEVEIDGFGNVIARKGKGVKKIMVAAHMDEIGLLVKYITKDGYLNFIKIGGIDDRVLVGQRVVVKSKKGDAFGIIGMKPPHLVKEEERKNPIKYTDMFIDIGARTKEEAEKRVSIADSVIFEPNAGLLSGNLIYGKAIDDRVGCFALIKILERLKINAQIYAVSTVQEEVGLKGARTSSFKINPDFAIAIDTTSAGDTPMIKENESNLKLGYGACITMIEAAGRGIIVSEKIKNLFIETAKTNKIKYQLDVVEGGMTDGAMINMNREGIPAGVLSVPSRYAHSPTGVFCTDDLNAVIELAVKAIEKFVKS